MILWGTFYCSCLLQKHIKFYLIVLCLPEYNTSKTLNLVKKRMSPNQALIFISHNKNFPVSNTWLFSLFQINREPVHWLKYRQIKPTISMKIFNQISFQCFHLCGNVIKKHLNDLNVQAGMVVILRLLKGNYILTGNFPHPPTLKITSWLQRSSVRSLPTKWKESRTQSNERNESPSESWCAQYYYWGHRDQICQFLKDKPQVQASLGGKS